MSEFDAQVLKIKHKIDEADEACWKIMLEKAKEAGIENKSTELYLFFQRVNMSQYCRLNQPRISVMFKSLAEDLK